MIFLKELLEKVDFEKNQQTTKKQEKLPRMQSVHVMCIFCVISVSKVSIKMPQAIDKCVRKQNIMFMHEKTQFCPEYFQFMKRLLTCNQIYTHSQQDKLVSFCCVCRLFFSLYRFLV